MKRTNKLMLATALVVVLAAAGVGGYLWWQSAAASRELPGTVVVVFAMPGEDQAVTAQMVVTVDTAAGTYDVADPNAEVPVPGTSYTKLRDAYPFGGAELVATALLEDDAQAAGWVDVSPEAWEKLLAGGFDVTIVEEFQAYDDANDVYSVFDLGPQHVAVADLGGFVNGVTYTGTAARTAALSDLAKASLAALARVEVGDGIDTSVDEAVWSEFVGILASARPAR